MRDRDTIVDPVHHRQVWQTPGQPGTVLADVGITGTWRRRKSGHTLTITITAFDSLPARARQSLEDEADQMAVLRGASSVNITYRA